MRPRAAPDGPPTTARAPRRRLPALLLAALCSGCGASSGSFAAGVYRDGAIAYRVGALGSQWRRIHVTGGQLAFHHDQGGTISAAATCEGPDHDAPLDVLTNHLLFGVEHRVERSRSAGTLDGRAALRTRADGTLDGVPIALDLVVLERDGCIYDLQLIAGPTAINARRPDFDRFLDGFGRVKKDAP